MNTTPRIPAMRPVSRVPIPARVLLGELDEAAAALTAFDVERLEAMEQRIQTITAAHLARRRELLPELLEKHALLGRLLEVTAANLRVLVSVLQLEPRMEMR